MKIKGSFQLLLNIQKNDFISLFSQGIDVLILLPKKIIL